MNYQLGLDFGYQLSSSVINFQGAYVMGDQEACFFMLNLSRVSLAPVACFGV